MKRLIQWLTQSSPVGPAAAAFCLLLNSNAWGATNGLAAALQKGLFEEEANRNLDEAIKAYQSALGLFDQDKKLAATAVFRLAECYRKQGNTNAAVEHYQALLRDFPEETGLAGLSRQQLLAFGSSATAPPGQAEASAPSKEEADEIARIRELIRNSPDLINAFVAGTGWTPLQLAASKGQVRVAEYLLASGAEVDRQTTSGETSLHLAARNGHRAVVELLLSHQADVNAKTSAGTTPLQLAVNLGFRTVAEVLINAGAKVDARDNEGQTALHYAAAGGFASLVEWLIDHRAEVDAQTKEHVTPLLRAVVQGKAEVVRILLDHKANPNLPGNIPILNQVRPGVYPVHAAVLVNRDDILKTLLDHKADPNSEAANDKLTPLFYAGNRPSTVQLLLNAGADPNRKNQQSRTPLMLAAQGQAVEVAEALLRAKADPNVRDERGQTALFLAVGQRSQPLVKLLIEAKADVNAEDSGGYTPLVFACDGAEQALVELLLNSGADPNPSGRKLSPMAIAQERLARTAPGSAGYSRYEAIVGLLKKHGAVEDLPQMDRIEIRRAAIKYRDAAVYKGTNDWNRFTLLEVLAIHYGFLSAIPKPQLAQRLNGTTMTRPNALPFPDLAHVTILPVGPDGRRRAPISVDVAQMLAGSNLGVSDPQLQWGSAIELPEKDHPLSGQWSGWSEDELQSLSDRLKRTVNITINQQTTNLVLYIGHYPRAARFGTIEQVIPQFTLVPVLRQTGLLRTSSDQAHVRVVRSNQGSIAWELDCSNSEAPPDLWIRDGDRIEVPEKRTNQ